MSFVPLPSNKLPGAGCSQEDTPGTQTHPLFTSSAGFLGEASPIPGFPTPILSEAMGKVGRLQSSYITDEWGAVLCHCTAGFTIAVSHTVLIVLTGKSHLVNNDQCT